MKLRIRTRHEVRHLESVDVEITDASPGPRFIAASGEELRVSLRDGGFEIQYIPLVGDEVVLIHCAEGTVIL